MKKIILINPCQRSLYEFVKIKEGAIYSPVLSLATIAAPCLKEGHQVKIFDMNLLENNEKKLVRLVRRYSPDFVGITFTTPLFPEMVNLAQMIKKELPRCRLLGGGAHASSFPKETLEESPLDLVVIGEGDFVLQEILSGKRWEKIAGVCFNKNKKIKKTRPRKFITDLDSLPYPAWQLYDLSRYQTSALLTRANPAGWLETSRGCIYGCVYCNKSVFGRTFRVKSAVRVVDEIEFMLKMGFKEIHIADDNFTSDMKRAEEVCDKILEKGLKFPWATVTGIRVDRVSQKLLQKMKKAGCYRVYFGIESGSQNVLDNIKKGINLKQIRQAVKWAKKAELETFGFFMIALPGEKTADIKKTIKLATSLDLDIAKMSITVPLPATPLFKELEKQGRIKTRDWSQYNLYLPASTIYDHPFLDWQTVDQYFSLFYRRFYFNPRFLTKRFIFAIKNKTLVSDIKSALRTKW